jgi:hypothetical protein
MEFIEKYPDKPWDWSYISNNTFKKHKIIIRRILQRWYTKLYTLNNFKLFIYYIDTLYEIKQASYITKYSKYNIVKYI